MKTYRIDLDDFAEDIFSEMESISDEGTGHYCDIIAPSKDHAAAMIKERLLPFLRSKLYERK